MRGFLVRKVSFAGMSAVRRIILLHLWVFMVRTSMISDVQLR